MHYITNAYTFVRKIIVGVDKRNCFKKTPDGLFDDPEDFILNARLIYGN